MNIDFKKINIKIVGVAVLVLLGAYWAYGYFSTPVSPTDGITVTTGDGASLAAASGIVDPFLELLLGLNDVTLSEKTLLSDPIFKEKMQDFSQPLPAPVIGRPNPFLPVGSTSSDSAVELGGVSAPDPNNNIGSIKTDASTTASTSTSGN